MGLPSFLACIYLIFTILLLFKRDKFGNMFIIYGCSTFAYVITYLSILSVPSRFQGFMLFLSFSFMIFTMGLTFAVILKLMGKSNRASRNASVISVMILIVFLFKIDEYIYYLYIPLLLNKLTDIINSNVCIGFR